MIFHGRSRGCHRRTPKERQINSIVKTPWNALERLEPLVQAAIEQTQISTAAGQKAMVGNKGLEATRMK